MTRNGLVQRVAIITGAGALTALPPGWVKAWRSTSPSKAGKSWSWTIRPKTGKEFASQIGGDFYAADVRNWKQLFDAFEETLHKYSRLDFVYGNAGKVETFEYFDPGTKFTADEVPNMETLDINLLGVTYTTLLALSCFRRNPAALHRPLLVLTASAAGLYPTQVQSLYCASKHAVVGLTRSVGLRVQSEGIRVCCLAPGLVPTDIMPKEILESVNPNSVTKVSHIVAAINDMLNNDRTATVCEVIVGRLYYRDPPAFCDEAQKEVITEISSKMADDFKKPREASLGK